MNPSRWKCIFVLLLLTLLGVGPMPITSIIGIYVVVARPRWFRDLVRRVYDE
ncbi:MULTISPECIES: hypothetical protein [Methylococcus]|jgi:hypothetical protein|uniref:Uncharacterized protein n=2 Tax=Methylococcus capsulatus TaxID=414 RepID=Q60CD3_METCA|nr:hypothetical protein [Methylococcus capsulatus]AAU90556.1 hypothetical protein MCA0175 [Methylococcus capsulatus str. Bath]QXP86334.1 hypothetical protein KW112_07790 [Methylococcus capsulatus]QXP89448.1 hypothetical protein KW114_10015 [Methylococcus capsulatus]QXP93995.1 hypothetical protein KW113_01850 [Methylococcus capsulatus]UQN11271.1 hypothetical protein M3M30_09530 [Methylococcus capsulatus]